jgi:hypothetical protein
MSEILYLKRITLNELSTPIVLKPELLTHTLITNMRAARIRVFSSLLLKAIYEIEPAHLAFPVYAPLAAQVHNAARTARPTPNGNLGANLYLHVGLLIHLRAGHLGEISVMSRATCLSPVSSISATCSTLNRPAGTTREPTLLCHVPAARLSILHLASSRREAVRCYFVKKLGSIISEVARS